MSRKILIFLFAFLLVACQRSNDDGEILKFFGDAKEDIAYSVAVAADGYYIAGQLSMIKRNGLLISSVRKKAAIIKTNFDGNMIWMDTLGVAQQGFFSKVIILSDGSVAAVGQVTDAITTKTDILVAKINSDESNPVSNVFSCPVSTTGYYPNLTGKDILPTPEGFMVLGTTDAGRDVTSEAVGNNEGKLDIIMLRVSTSLVQIDANPPVWGFPENDEGVTLRAVSGGGFMLTGSTERYKAEGHKHDLFMLKTNSLGAEVGYTIIGGTDDEYAADFDQFQDGYVVVGNIGANDEIQSVFVKKISFDLDSLPLVSNTITNANSWSVNAMARYKTSSIVLAGREGSSTLSKILVFVVDAGGGLQENQVKVSGSTGVQVAYDIATDSDNNIITVGKNTFQSNSLITLLKFSF